MHDTERFISEQIERFDQQRTWMVRELSQHPAYGAISSLSDDMLNGTIRPTLERTLPFDAVVTLMGSYAVSMAIPGSDVDLASILPHGDIRNVGDVLQNVLTAFQDTGIPVRLEVLPLAHTGALNNAIYNVTCTKLICGMDMCDMRNLGVLEMLVGDSDAIEKMLDEVYAYNREGAMKKYLRRLEALSAGF